MQQINDFSKAISATNMDIVILTSNRRNTASFCLSLLLKSPEINVVKVIYCEARVKNRIRFYKKKFQKILNIGLAGAINGIRIRKWYDGAGLRSGLQDIGLICASNGIPFSVTPSMYDPKTVEEMATAKADLGLSLGNSYIPKKVFSIPRMGMLNIHGEVLPAFQNAQSVIWQIHEGSSMTGYTIHRIDSHIDTGDILLQEKFPILFGVNLEETVRHTVDLILEKAGHGLVKLLENYPEYESKAYPQGKGRSFTTPSLREFFKMKNNFRKLSSNKG